MAQLHKLKTAPPSCKASADKAGFTAIELVVSLAIIILVSAQVFVSFSGLGQGVTLTRTAQELVGEIRKAQYGSLAVMYSHVPVAGVPSFVIPPAIGVRLSASTVPPQVIRFADRNDSGFTQNNKYDGIDERIGMYTFPGGIVINNLTDQNNASYTALNVMFQIPEGTLAFTKDDGTAILGNRVTIELANSSGAKKTVTVLITGEINVR